MTAAAANLVGHPVPSARSGAGATADERDLAGEVGPTVGSRVTALHVDGRRGEFTRDAPGRCPGCSSSGCSRSARRLVRPQVAGRVDPREEVRSTDARAVTGRAELLLDVGPGGPRRPEVPAPRLPSLASAMPWRVSRWRMTPWVVTASAEFARCWGCPPGRSGRNAGGDQPGEAKAAVDAAVRRCTHVVVSVSSGFPERCAGALDPRRVGGSHDRRERKGKLKNVQSCDSEATGPWGVCVGALVCRRGERGEGAWGE